MRVCVRACVHAHRLSFVCWTCPRVLAGSTWNLFRSTIYELTLCTSYFWSASVRPFVCERRRNLGLDSIWQFQVIFFPMFCPELLRRFWSDQSETYTDWIYMGWSCTPPLGGDVGPSVCLWEVSELRSPQHFTNPECFFQCSLLNLSWGFSRINLKPIQIEYIWVGVVHLSLRAASHRPFFCQRGLNLAPTAF